MKRAVWTKRTTWTKRAVGATVLWGGVAATLLLGCGRPGPRSVSDLSSQAGDALRDAADAIPTGDKAPRPAPAQTVKPANTGSAPSATPVATHARAPSATGAKPAGTGEPPKEGAIDYNRLPLFEGWPQPQVAIVITGEMDGYIEPCGCAGKENQKGGLSRRYTFLKGLRDKGWDVAPIDLGGQVKRFGRQTEMKFHRVVEGLREMQYAAIGLGYRDCSLPAEDLLSEAGDAEGPFVSANVGVFDASIPVRYKILERGGRKIGVTSVLGDEYVKQLNNSDLVFTPAAEALEAAVKELKGKADYLVLLSHATRDESLALAKKFPVFDVVVTAGGADEPPFEPKAIDGGKSILIEVGHKGMYGAVIGLYPDAKQPWRYQRVPFDARFADSDEMVALMRSYQEQLKTVGLEGLQIRPLPHPSGRSFVGSAACADCHTSAHTKFMETTHSTALDTLERLDPPRNHDPECLSCHVVGWEPQKFYPFATGYLSREETPELVHQGCENCHGPGKEHVAAENGTDLAEQTKRRKEMVVSVEQSEKECRACHDLDNSPKFKFDEYWPVVEHKGKD